MSKIPDKRTNATAPNNPTANPTFHCTQPRWANDAQVVLLDGTLDTCTPSTLGIEEVPYLLNINMRVPFWQPIKENERDMPVSDLCPVEQGSDSLKRRYLLVPKS
jgi:hypothetical protein